MLQLNVTGQCYSSLLNQHFFNFHQLEKQYDLQLPPVDLVTEQPHIKRKNMQVNMTFLSEELHSPGNWTYKFLKTFHLSAERRLHYRGALWMRGEESTTFQLP